MAKSMQLVTTHTSLASPTTAILLSKGTDATGVFYGIQTLRALLPVESYRQVQDAVTVAAIEVRDAPQFKYRGMHLDVARNFQKEATVKKLLELMAFYKLNKFHFHLTDDEGWRLGNRRPS